MKKHLSTQTRKRMLSSIGLILFSVSFVLAQVLVKGTVKDNLGEGVPGAVFRYKVLHKEQSLTLMVNLLLTYPIRIQYWLFLSLVMSL